MNEQTYKPGSVFDNHLSRLIVTNKLKRPTIRAATGRRLLRPIWSCSGWGLYGQHVTMLPVSSYLTISTFPWLPEGAFSGYISVGLLHLKYPSNDVTKRIFFS